MSSEREKNKFIADHITSYMSLDKQLKFYDEQMRLLKEEALDCENLL